MAALAEGLRHAGRGGLKALRSSSVGKRPGLRDCRGVVVGAVRPGSPAARAGLKAGDSLVAIDGTPITDFLDFYLGAFGPEHDIDVMRGSRRFAARLIRRRGADLGAEIRVGRIKPCGNRCVFCFVDQLPAGLRPELHFKDEDYRLSFLHGNYLTLTNLTRADEARIRSRHLSPLFVSVHSTDDGVRARLLGRRPAEPVLATMRRLARSGVGLHAQIVVVPGYNDGPILASTLRDLSRLGRCLLSVSVVPVGLTSHRRGLAPLRPVDAASARAIVDQVAGLNTRTRSRTSSGRFYASDEMIILAGREIPGADYYDDFPQIENGVGLVRTFLDQLDGLRVPRSLRGRRLRLVTGTLARPFLERLATRLETRGVRADVVPVVNSLFGPGVTVSGLLPGRAVLAALGGLDDCDAVVLPPDIVNADGVTLDELTPSEMARALGVPVMVAQPGLGRTLTELAGLAERN